MALGQFKDVAGMRFGALVAMRRISPTGAHDARWEARCDCGRITEVSGSNLRRSKSCGCKRFHTRHGACRRGKQFPIYGVWAAIVQRCTNPKCTAYKYYGGRGIRVCDRWLDFANFMADMGEKPSSEHSVDRIDNHGNYEPSNCRWATRAEQSANRRSGRLYAILGRLQDQERIARMLCDDMAWDDLSNLSRKRYLGLAEQVSKYAIYGIQIREV